GKIVQRIVRLVVQSVVCSGCGICVQQCPSKSIDITEGFPKIDEEKCNRCKSCLERCPVLSYGLTERLTKSIPEKMADLVLERSPKNI
ncbi:MAG: 4Fe-4S dicluster domain-containing protein, partial [Promethearchaeota archaeon]